MISTKNDEEIRLMEYAGKVCYELLEAMEGFIKDVKLDIAKTFSNEDFEKEIETMAEVYQMDASKVKEMLGEKEMKNIRQDLAVKKAAEFVVENAKEK